ncbi:MAG: family N-acetyltransferase [Myxococcales bacterium]|nr:family N-acetyltransferase [Myxococcales bacterium]
MRGLPDVPRWVEAHGIASDPEHWIEPVGAGFALGHDPAQLIVVAGDADADAVKQLAIARGHTLLLAIEREDLVAAVSSVRRPPERAILHTLADPDALPELEGATPLDSLDGVPDPLASELAWARQHGPVWSAWLEGEPVSFAYAPWRSAKWFDVSVDTLPHARQLGLAGIVASAMIRDERARGREPVWGADQGNLASLRLAKRLGFEPVDEIWVCAHA